MLRLLVYVNVKNLMCKLFLKKPRFCEIYLCRNSSAADLFFAKRQCKRFLLQSIVIHLDMDCPNVAKLFDQNPTIQLLNRFFGPNLRVEPQPLRSCNAGKTR